MLDNTVVLWGSELAKGNTHTRSDTWVMAGGCGGYFRTGRYLALTSTSTHVAMESVKETRG